MNEVEIVVKSRDESAPGFNSAKKSADGYKNKLGEVAKMASGFIAANVVAKGAEKLKEFIGGSVEAASSLGESLNAVNKIFGSSQSEILKWGKTTANSYGLSQRAFNDLAVPLGAGLKNMGFSQKEAAKQTIELTKRASDMASVFNTSVPEALEAINSGLKGEADPLERYGVGLSAAAVEAEALSETHKKSAKSLTKVELSTARVNMIMKQTSATAGDFVGTSDGLANSQRIAAAKSEELAAKIGAQLIPAVQFLTRMKVKLMDVVANKLLPALISFGGWIKEHSGTMKIMGAIVGGVLVAAFTAWAASAAAAAAATIAATLPLIAIGAAIGLLVYAFMKAWKSSDKFRAVVTQVMVTTAQVVLTGAQLMIKAYKGIADAVLTVVEGILRALGKIPGNDWADRAADDVKGFKDKTDKFFNQAIKKTDDWKRAVDNLPRKIKLEGDIRDLQRKVDSAKAKLRTIPKSRNARVLADIRSAQNSIARIRARLLGIKDRYVNVFVSEVNRDRATAGRGPSGKATGGVIGAASGGARGGLVEVGEHGRELVRLPFGSTVIPHGGAENLLKALKELRKRQLKELAAALKHRSRSQTGHLGHLAGDRSESQLGGLLNRLRGRAGSQLDHLGGIAQGKAETREGGLSRRVSGHASALPVNRLIRPGSGRTSSGGSGGDGCECQMVLEIRSAGSRLDDLLVELIRKAVRAQGGNVQLVLGKN